MGGGDSRWKRRKVGGGRGSREGSYLRAPECTSEAHLSNVLSSL